MEKVPSIFGLKLNKSLFAVAHDVSMALISLPISAILLYDMDEVNWWRLIIVTLTFSVIAAFCFRLVGMYRGIWRYASIGDLINIIRASVFSVVLFCPIISMVIVEDKIAVALPVFQLLILASLLGGPRFFYRAWKDGFLDHFIFPSRYGNQKNITNILLIGAGDMAELFIRSLTQNRLFGYRVVGILDDRPEMHGKEMHGVAVLGRTSDLDMVLSVLSKTGNKPQRLIFTERSKDDEDVTNRITINDLNAKVEQYGLAVARLPNMTEFQEGLAHGQGAMQLKPIAIEDLLGRPQADLDVDAIRDFVKGQTALITGAGGTIGSELSRQIANFGASKIILLDNGEFNLYSVDYDLRHRNPMMAITSHLCSIRDLPALERIFDKHKPDIVFHAAALKHVPLVELNPAEGILTNVVGTKNVAECARKYGAKAMVQISTDKAVNPTNVMGASKRLGEYYAQALDLMQGEEQRTRFMTVRFGNVLGSSGSVVPLFRKQLEQGGPLTVTHPDIKRFFMTVKEAVNLVLQASAHGMQTEEQRGRIFVLDMGEPVRILDLAHQMIRLSSLKPDKDIKVVFTGLRPGEKLYEELFDRNEKPVETDSPGIMAAIPQPIDISLLRRTIDNLEGYCRDGNTSSIFKTIGSVVPGYTRDTTLVSEALEDDQGIKIADNVKKIDSDEKDA